jgi:HK97 family phage major capsid protein
MNLKEKLKTAQSELLGLKAKIESGDAEAIKRAGELTTEIENLKEQIKTAEKAAQLLAQIGNGESEQEGAKDTRSKSLGEHFVKAAKKANASKGQHFSVHTSAFKAATDTQTSPSGISQFATDLDYNVVTAPRTALVIRDLFGSETISGNALTYLVEGAMEGTPAVTAEGAKKAQVHFADPTPVTVSLKKITEFIKESDEYINDYPFLASAINGRLLYALGLKEQNELVSDLIGTSGIQTDSTSWTGTTKADELADIIFSALMNVQEQSGYAADAIAMNPATWQLIRLGKDGNGQYYGGGYFSDGQGKQLWGIPVVVTTAVTASQIIVGAFKTCGSVVSKGGVSVEATNSNEDDFLNNLMTIRAEERLALAVRRPAGFKLISK